MEIHIWKGRGLTIELTEAQEEAVIATLGLEVDPDENSYSCYSDEVIKQLTGKLKKI